MFLITLVNRHGHDVCKFLCPLDRSETELILREQGWECDNFQERMVWSHPDRDNIIRLEKVTPMSQDEIRHRLRAYGLPI